MPPPKNNCANDAVAPIARQASGKVEMSQYETQTPQRKGTRRMRYDLVAEMKREYLAACDAAEKQEKMDAALDCILKDINLRPSVRAKHGKLWSMLAFIQDNRQKAIRPSDISKLFGSNTKIACGIARSHIKPYQIPAKAIDGSKLWFLLETAARLLDGQ